MLKLRDFKDHGFVVTKHVGLEKDWAKYLIQKKVCDCYYNTKYFINVYMSDMRFWSCFDKIPKGIRQYRSYCVKVQMYKNDMTFDITINHDEGWNSVSDIEVVVEKVWVGLNMDNDHHN